MKSKFMRGLALGLAMVTAFTFSAPNSALLNAQAAKAKMTASAKKIKAGGTVTYKVTNLKKSYYYTVKVTGAGKKLVQVKKGKTTVKAYKKTAVSKKAKVGAKTLTLKATNNSKKTSAQKYTVTVKVYKTKNAKKAFKTFKTTTTIKKAAAKKVAATGVTLDKEAYTVGLNQNITLFATPVPADTTDKAVWTSSDETVATVANGVVTGVKEGTADITVTYGSASATAKVTVSKEAIIYNLTDVKQTASNKVQLTFDNPEAKNLTQKSDVVIQNAAGTLVNQIESFEWDATGTVAVATVTPVFSDKTDYTVTFKNGTPITFTAVVGEVASVALLTVNAQQNVETKIDFALYDATGMDVTANEDINSRVTLDVSGSYSNTANFGTPKKATITQSNVGDEATITITYNKGAANSENIVGTGKIVCVDAQAVVGEGVFVDSDNTNMNSNCAKFYRSGMSDTSVTVQVDKDRQDVYFYAKDENGKAIKYETYDATSSNDDIMTVSVDAEYDNDSRFTKLTVTGNKIGSASVNIKATINGKETNYTIPVTVVKKATFSTLTVNVDKASISNALDYNYYGELTAKAKDDLGNDINLDGITVEFADSDKKSELDKTNAIVSDMTAELGDTGFRFNSTTPGGANMDTYTNTKIANMAPTSNTGEYKAYYAAWGAKSGSYVLKVTGTHDGKDISRSITVSVKKLTQNAMDPAVGATMTYKVELSKNVVDEADKDNNSLDAKLYAEAGGVFAGYVYAPNTDAAAGLTGAVAKIGTGTSGAADLVVSSGAAGTDKYGITNIKGAGGAFAASGSGAQLVNIKQFVKYAGKYTTGTNVHKLYYSEDAATPANITNYTDKAAAMGVVTGVGANTPMQMNIQTVDTTSGNMYYVAGDATNDKFFAKTGTGTVYYRYQTLKDIADGSTKETDKTTTFSVKNSIVVPTVSYTSRTVDSLDGASIKDVLEANVDMNNKDLNYSISDTMYKKFNKNNTEDIAAGTSSVTVKYVCVTETDKDVAASPINFWIPLGVSFTTED